MLDTIKVLILFKKAIFNHCFAAFVVTLLIFAGQSCLAQNNYSIQFGQPVAQSISVLDDREAIAAQADHAIKREITITAMVKKVLATDSQGLPHQRFLLQLSNNTTVLVAHDLKFAPPVPIKPFDVVRVHGEYIWNKLGGLIHWTHHSDNAKHESGWIEFNGICYQ